MQRLARSSLPYPDVDVHLGVLGICGTRPVNFDSRLIGPVDPYERMPLTSNLQGEDFSFYGRWEIHKHKETLMIKVVLTALVDDPNQVVFGRSSIRMDSVDLAEDKRRLVIGVIDTEHEGLWLCVHHSSR